MKEFAHLIIQLDQTNKTLKKVEALKSFFLSASDTDKVWALALFTHKRPKRKVSTSMLRQWTIEWSGIPEWLFQESYQVVGDIAETISLLLPNEPSEEQRKKDLSLTHYINLILSLEGLENEEKEIKLKETYKQLDKQEKFVLTKIISGGWRVGVSQNLVTRAIAEVHQIEQAVVAHKLMGNWDPSTTSFESLIIEENLSDQLSKPYPFYLAYPLEGDVKELGDPKEWSAEWKWDGIRGQLINRNGTISIWSRGEELITDKFPELEEAIAKTDQEIVLDGEILPYKNGVPLPFGKLQTRIGLKNVSSKIVEQVPVIFKAYDIIELNKQDLRDKPYKERRTICRQFIDSQNNESLQFSESVTFANWRELDQLQKQARDHKTEGFMLKRVDSTYEVGRKKGDWWKWKVEPLTIDGVMLYAQKGHGRRAGLYSDYTLAVWDSDTLVPFAKAYSGLTDKEMREVSDFVKKHTKEKFGPVRTVKPELVFEIAFEGINESKRHKSGVALRFPRIKRWRKDKKVEEANTLLDLQKMLEQYG